jgi:formate-dependent nitrite reductase cytochrome c552 subunit
LIAEHQDIVMDHEAAMTCYTCHSRTNRERLVDIYGTEVAFEQSENICRRCHGPRYRDWKLGIHGRLMGYWDTTKGTSTNITCVGCHDPHAPQFQRMRPSPPPSRDHYITEGRNTTHAGP